jgi:hypothetical protein
MSTCVSAGGVVGTSEVGQKLLSLILSLYIVTVGLAATYYNWEYARTHGFLPWVFFGEVVPSAKAFIWPYFAFHKGGSSGTRIPIDVELKKTALTPAQISEMEAKKLILAINYSQQATYLLNSAPHENLADYPNLPEILAYRRKAIEVGRSVNADTLNAVYRAWEIDSRGSLLRQSLYSFTVARRIRTTSYITASC